MIKTKFEKRSSSMKNDSVKTFRRPALTHIMNNHFFRISRACFLFAVIGAAQIAVADVETWIGNPGSTSTTNWSDTANWSGTSQNPNDNIVNFGTSFVVAQGVVNNVVDTSTNCAAIVYTNTAGYNNTLIQPGQTLKIDGNSSGAALTATPGGQVQITNTISGATGTLLITGPAACGVYVATTNSSAGSVPVTLDMSGLGTFIISNTSAATAVTVGGGQNRSDGVLFLAMTNYISLNTNGTGNSSALTVGDNTSNNGSSPGGVLNLGVTNQIFADNIGIGLSKQTVASMRFNPAFTNGGANPVVYIRGFSGTPVKKWAIGDGLNQSGTSVGGTGTVDFRSGTVNAVVSAMVLGRPSPTSTTAPTSTGTLSFNAGSISVVNLTNAMMTIAGGTTNQSAKGTINISDTAKLSAANVVMAIYLGGSGTSVAALNVNNGTLALGTVTVGTGSSSINLTNGTLIITNIAGSPAAPLSTLSLSGGALHLSVNGNSIVSNIVATAVTTSGTTAITIDSITNYPGSGTYTFPLISYTGTDPFPGLGTPGLPPGFSGSMSDDAGKVDLVITSGPNTLAPVVANMTWTGAGSDNNWSTGANWGGTNLNPGDTLFFDGTTRLANNNDTPAGTLYSNITFQSTAGAFVLGGNAVTLATGSGTVANNSANIEQVNLGLDYTGNITLAGGSSAGTALIIGNGLTNTAANSVATITLGGVGTLTNLFGTTANNNTNTIATAASTANWTIVDNPLSSPVVVSNLGFNILGGGTLNFGNAGSAPVLSSLIGGQGSDNGLGDSGTAATLNMVNGTFTIGRRLNTQNGNINVSGGTLNVWNQLQMDNSSSGNVSAVTVSGGTLNVWNSTGTSTSGTLFLASRGQGMLNLSGSGLVQCSTLDISRVAVAGTRGTLNLDGGTLAVNTIATASQNNVGTNGAETATLNFNGGTLKVRSASSANYFQQNGTGGNVASNVLINLIVKTGGAVFDSNGQTISNLLVLQHDSTLGGTPDGGLTKIGNGTVALAAANTYSGNTKINAGVLALVASGSIASSPAITIAGGGTFDVSALSSTFTLGGSQTLSNSSSAAVLDGNANTGSGTVALTYAAGTPSLNVTNGTLTLASGTTFNINNTGATLASGATPYKLISKSATGNAGAVAGLPASFSIGGSGYAGGAMTFLQISNAELLLIVDKAPVIANIVTNGAVIGSSWKIAKVDLATAAGWSDPDGDTVTLSDVSATSFNGTNMSTDATYIYYNGAVTGEDHFTYTVTDGYLTTTGTVYLEAIPATLPPVKNPTFDVNGHPTFSGTGIPGYVLGVEYATDINGPWANAGSATVDNNSNWTFTDNAQTNPGNIFYRIYYPYNPSNPPQ
jgi:autotransporter-associated beta strand protein